MSRRWMRASTERSVPGTERALLACAIVAYATTTRRIALTKTQNTRAKRRARGERAEVERAARRRARAVARRRGEHTAASATDAGLDSLQVFLAQAARYPLLTAAEEIE